MRSADVATPFALAAGLVAATYAYFLLFAQFAFLELAAAVAPDRVPLLLAAQGGLGIAGSLAAGRHSSDRALRLVGIGLGLGGLAALLAGQAGSVGLLAVSAAATGFGVGLATVALAAELRRLAGPRLGQAIGLGTGLGYALCSFPAVFEAGARAQSLVAAALAAAGAGIALVPLRRGTGAPPPPAGPPPVRTALGWMLGFAALVTLDSAAFYIIQHSAEMKAAAWSGAARQHAVAGVHLAAALAAGRMLDAGRIRLVSAAALGMLVLACLLLARPAGWHSLLYAAGVSLYSTALVFVPARAVRPGFAALFYITCGWLASGLGLALAQGRAHVPGALVASLAALAALGLAVTR
ncbi:MAG TPA: hypothetical protein VEB66_08565 [Opitutaceae bacterium]|nr:hypothetical protein [Opitutaceae bacterium]